MDFPILYEDHTVVVISKPVGIVVNKATTVKTSTVQDWMEEKFPELFRSSLSMPAMPSMLAAASPFQQSTVQDFYNRTGIVHRIDKETSGCLIIAKTPEAFLKLQSAFKERAVKKEYVALVHGVIKSKTGEIDAPVGRLPWNRERFGIVPEGKEAHTHFEVETYYEDGKKNKYTFVRLFPTTGRTHQLRIHLKYLGFPIVGDYLYAGRKQQRNDRAWCPRVFLHAEKVIFPHPITHEEKTIIAPLASELVEVMAGLTSL